MNLDQFIDKWIRADRAAYGWPADISEEDALAKLLELNLARSGAGDLLADAEDEDDGEDDEPAAKPAKRALAGETSPKKDRKTE